MSFPLNSNDAYIKTTGERTTLGAALGSGGTSELPEYSESDAGKVLTVGDDGELEWNEPEEGGLYGVTVPSSSLGEDGDTYYKCTASRFTCDESYYVDTTTQLLCTHSRAFYKLSTDPCIAVHYKNSSYYGPLLIGLTPDSVKYTGNSVPMGAYEVSGAIWYVGEHESWSTSTDTPSIPTMYDDTLALNAANAATIIARVLEAAHVSLTPDVYVKTNGSWVLTDPES